MPPKKKSVKKNSPTKRVSRSTALPVKKKSGSTNVQAIKKTGRNKSISTKILEEPVADYSEMRQVLMGGAAKPAQLKVSKQFDWGWFEFSVILAIFLLGVPLIIYTVYNWTKHRQS